MHRQVPLLGRTICRALPAFSAYTGIDTTAAFKQRAKIKCWSAWQKCPSVTSAFQYMSSSNPTKSGLRKHLPALYRFTNTLYGETDPMAPPSVDKFRLKSIVYGGKTWDSIAPCSDALWLKILRATYQAGHIWGTMFSAKGATVKPQDWGGWSMTDGKLSVQYTEKPVISRALKPLNTCGCKPLDRGQCVTNCSCSKIPMPCSKLCACDGVCGNPAPKST